jgi:hypothetical protein
MDKTRAVIRDMFKRAVENAVVAKCFLYCKRLARKVTINIKSRYQKFNAIKGEASFFAFSSKPVASKSVSIFEKRVTNTDKISIIINNFLKTSHAKRGLFFAEAKLGRKLCVKAPSANIRRKRFGNLNATKNISE